MKNSPLKCAILSCLALLSSANAGTFDYEYAFVRQIPDSFEQSLKLSQPDRPIDIDLAKKQHEKYVDLLKALVPNVVEVETSHVHPDSNFVEDTAIVINGIAVMSIMGAPERQGEELAVRETFEKVGFNNIVTLVPPAKMDGGDILYTGHHVFVGISHRTNEYALSQLTEFFAGTTEVVGVPVIEGLHLKSVISLIDNETLVVADTTAGQRVKGWIETIAPDRYTFVQVPDSVASNVLRVGSTLFIQAGFPESEKILKKVCKEKKLDFVTFEMSELIKADGALTCGCILFNN